MSFTLAVFHQRIKNISNEGFNLQAAKYIAKLFKLLHFSLQTSKKSTLSQEEPWKILFLTFEDVSRSAERKLYVT